MGKFKTNGAWLYKENEIKESFAQAGHNLLSDSGDWKPSTNEYYS